MQDLVKKILGRIKEKNNVEAEVYLSRTKGLSIEVEKQKIKAFEKSDDLGIGIRIFDDGRGGFSCCSGISEEIIDQSIENALKSLSYSGKEISRKLPDNKNVRYAESSPYTAKLNDVQVESKIDAAMKLEKYGLDFDRKITKTNKSSYQESEFEVIVQNTLGINFRHTGSMCGCSITFIAEENGTMETGWEVDSGKSFKDLDLKKTGITAAKKAVMMIGAKPISTGTYPVIFDNIVTMEFLALLSSSLCADQIQKGKSMFQNKIGLQVASEILTIEDNGFHDDAVTCFSGDSEGVPVKGTTLIEKGILKNFLYDTYTANKEKRESTGNGFRTSYKGTPSVGISNLFIKADKSVSFDEMLSSMGRGLLVTEAIGVHTADPVTGDFSFGVEGMLIESGKISSPVRGIMIAGNIIEMIKNIEMIENRLRFLGRIGAPAIKISGLSVSGN